MEDQIIALEIQREGQKTKKKAPINFYIKPYLLELALITLHHISSLGISRERCRYKVE